MMSLSFPPAPTNGQQYQNWVWNSSVGAWLPNYAAGFVTSFNGRAGAVTLQTQDNTVGNRVLLQSQIISTPVASLDMIYNFTNAYDLYDIEIYNMTCSVAGNLGAYCTFDGTTWDTSQGNYVYAYAYAVSSGTGGGVGAPLSYLYLSLLDTTTSSRTQVEARLITPWITSRGKQIFNRFNCYSTAAGGWVAYHGFVANGNTTQSLRGLRFFGNNGGNLNSGVINLYGKPKAGAGAS